MGRLSVKKWPVITAITLICACSGNKSSPPSGGRLVFEDGFDREALGDAWLDTGGRYRIVDGELRARGAKNKPLWLKQKLPRDARIEFDARSESDAVDIKVEAWGDGRSKATALSYNATSYVIILGGWNNSRSIIARMDEHGDDRKVRTDPKAEKGKKYHFSIVRKGGTLSWYLDSALFLELEDSAPLAGDGHEHFAVNNWASEVFFDNLKIFAL